MMIMFAAIFTIIMVMGALVVDVGLWLSERRSAVKAADLAALAGSQDLPANDQLAMDNALEWAERNGYENGVDGVKVEPKLFCSNTLTQAVSGICHKSNPSNPEPEECSTGQHCDSIRVTITKPGSHIFSKFFGLGDIQEGSAAMAALSFGMVQTDVVLVIDKTGSMDQQTGGHTRLYWAKQAALAFVNWIAGGSGSSTLGNNHIEVLTFDGNATAQLVGPALGNSDADAVRAAINNIGDLSGSGDTYIAKGIEGATGDLNAHVHDDSYRVVVLLSDGRNYKNGDAMSGTFCNATHTRRTNTVAAIGPLHDEADTVYTVGVGNQTGTWDSCNPYELDEALLGDIAEGPPGDYTQVIDASTLPAVFQAIAWKIAGRALTQ